VQELTQEQLEEMMQQAGASSKSEGQRELQVSLEQKDSGASGSKEGE
jgi:hypothetical protein